MSGGGAEAGVKGDQAVVESGQTGCVGYADGGSGRGTEREGGVRIMGQIWRHTKLLGG